MYQSARSRRNSYAISNSSARDDLFFYFFNIERDGFVDLQTFKSNWNKIVFQNFSPKGLTNILLRTAQYVKSRREEDEALDRAEDPNTPAKQLLAIIINNWNKWEVPALKAIDKFNTMDLVCTLQAHDFLQISPTHDFQKRHFQRTEDYAASYNPVDFSIQFQSAARLGVQQHPNMARTLLTRMRDNPDFLEGRQKTDFTWALAALDSMFPRSEYRQIAQLIRPQLPQTVRTEAVQKMRHDMAFWFKWGDKFENVQREETTSASEHILREFLKEAGIRTEKHDNVIPRFPQAVDFSIVAGKTVPAELDGPTHMLHALENHNYHDINPIYNGVSRFRCALTHKAAPAEVILHIPHTIAETLTGDNIGQKYSSTCRHKIAAHYVACAQGAKPGVYRTSLGGRPKGECAVHLQSMLPRKVHLALCRT